MANNNAALSDVQSFWNRNPLFTGEAAQDEHFFARHTQTYYDDVLAGIDIERVFYFPKPSDHTLDLGCGIGFWTELFHRRGVTSITAADLSDTSLALAAKRLGGEAGVRFEQQNAEALTFADETFDHVNCQGVIHHTPDTDKAMSEIYRVLKRGGTASVSVYYDNVPVRHYDRLKYIVKPLAKLLLKNLGRGRAFDLPDDQEALVRLYDGNDNPIGKSYSKAAFVAMCGRTGFTDIRIRYFFFPGRFLAVPVPALLRKMLVWLLPFMIVANCRKI